MRRHDHHSSPQPTSVKDLMHVEVAVRSGARKSPCGVVPVDLVKVVADDGLAIEVDFQVDLELHAGAVHDLHLRVAAAGDALASIGRVEGRHVLEVLVEDPARAHRRHAVRQLVRLLQLDERAKVDRHHVAVRQPDEQHKVGQPLEAADHTVILWESQPKVLIHTRRVEREKILVTDAHGDKGRVVERECQSVWVARRANVPRHLGEHPTQSKLGV
mmetsp:Transcript_48376/g.126484  ORF Transcript_48376/g.126484 Transcript_48376/m.126484 type:complete len:216 (+) Transcript_48376:141-788(+)